MISDFVTTPDELWNHVVRGQQYLQPFCDVYHALRDEVAGSLWPGVHGQRPVNLLYEFDTVVESYTSVPTVRASVKPKAPSARQFCEILRLALNQTFQETKLAEVLEAQAAEAMMAPIAIVDVGRQEGSRVVELDGEVCNLQEGYARLIELPDLSVDPEAKSWRTKRFIAHRITVRKARIATGNPFGMPAPAPMGMMGEEQPGDPDAAAEATETPAVDDVGEPIVPGMAEYGLPVMTQEEAKMHLLASMDRAEDGSPINQTNRDMRQRDQIGISRPGDDETGEICLWRVVIYDGNKVYITYINDGEGQPAKFIHIEEWTETKIRPDGMGGEMQLGGGSTSGPLKALVYKPVRGSMLGIPGLATIWDLHTAAAKLSTKLVAQLMSLKNLLLYTKGGADDAMRVAKARDLDAIAVKDATAFTTAPIGGTRGELEPGIAMIGEWYGNQAGGPRQIGGSESNVDTATQANYLQNGANMRLQRYRTRLWRTACEIAEEMAFLNLFADPWATKQLEMQLAPGVNLPVSFNRAEIASDAIEFMFSVEPFPVPIFDPVQKRNNISEFLAFVTNNMPLIQMGVMNPKEIATIGRVEYGIENVDDLIVIDQLSGMAQEALMRKNAMGLMPAQVQQQMGGGGGGGPPSPDQMQGQIQAGRERTGGAVGRAGGAGGRSRPPTTSQKQPQPSGGRQ